MTFLHSFKTWLRGFRNDQQGTITVEAAVTLPLLFFAIAASYEFFEVHRYNSVRDKATYTIADMISRELQSVTPTYMNNTLKVFDTITNDPGQNAVRVSVVKYDAETDKYAVSWSQVRGTDLLSPLQTSDVATAHSELPKMADGEEVILVESNSRYQPIFNVGLNDDMVIKTRVMTSPRFAPQILWDAG